MFILMMKASPWLIRGLAFLIYVELWYKRFGLSDVKIGQPKIIRFADDYIIPPMPAAPAPAKV